MLKNKLLTILLTFSNYELNRFRKYLLSPFFNENQVLIQLFDFLSKKIKKKDIANLTKQEIWQQLFPTSSFEDVKFRRYCSDLTRLVTDFLTYEAYKKNTNEQVTTLIKVIADRNLSKLYEPLARKEQKRLEKQPIQDAIAHYQKYNLAATQGLFKHINRTKPIDILSVVKNLDAFYISEKLKYYCTLLNYQYLVDIKEELPFITPLMQYLAQANEVEKFPSITIYYYISLTLSTPKEENNYQLLKKALADYSHLFPKKEAWMMYGYAQNYCIRKINTGDSQYLDELFQLYKEGLDKGLLFTNDELSPWHYKNIVVVGLRLNAFDWVEMFIEKYHVYLNKSFQKNAYSYSLAKLHFYKKEYGKVIQRLQSITYEDMFYQLDAKSMLLKTYYELDEVEALYSLMDSFKILLKRKNVISDRHRTNHLNFLKILKKLLNLPSLGREGVAKIKEEIEATKQIADVNWLLEKLKEWE